MESVRIQVSPKQISKLRNGKKVRVRPAMEGGGINLVVSPSNYSLLSKSFTKNKGTDIILTPEEILANREQYSSMEGQGIFGKSFDKGAKQVLGARGKKVAYQYARNVLNPLAKGAITAGLATGGVALGAIQPELIPFIPAGVGGASYMIADYLDNPGAYQSNAGGPKSKQAKTLAGQYLQDQALGQINSQLGTNMGNLSRAGIEKAVGDKVSQSLTAQAIQAQQSLINRINMGFESSTSLSPEEKALLQGTPFEYMTGKGLYPMSGNGLYAGRQGGAIVGRNGGLVDKQPQALQSQSQSQNYQLKYTLPLWARVDK